MVKVMSAGIGLAAKVGREPLDVQAAKARAAARSMPALAAHATCASVLRAAKDGLMTASQNGRNDKCVQTHRVQIAAHAHPPSWPTH